MFRQQGEKLFNDENKIGDKKKILNTEAIKMAEAIYKNLNF